MAESTELLVTLKPGFTTVSPDRRTVLSFDREGRLYAYYKAGVTYRRTLASAVEVRYREDARRRERLSRAEAARLFAEVHRIAATCYRQGPAALRARFEEDGVLQWTPERLLAQEEAFLPGV